VLWTGNAYHIYQPVRGPVLEEYETFYEFTKFLDKDLTSMFIQFAEEYFTDYTADHLHNSNRKVMFTKDSRKPKHKMHSKQRPMNTTTGRNDSGMVLMI